MYGKTILAVLVAVALLGFISPVSAMHTGPSVTYVTGNTTPDPAVGLVLCEGPDGALPDEVGAGGACRVTCTGQGGTCTVSVADDTHGPWGFHYRCESASGVTGPEFGSVSFPNTCAGGATGDKHVTVFVHVGGTTGTITALKS